MKSTVLESSQKKPDFFPMVDPSWLRLLAPLLWTAAGLKLVLRGGMTVDWQLHPLILLAAIVIGCAKSLLFLDGIANKNVKRLDAYLQPVFIGRVFPMRTWAIIAAMILLGRLMRYSSLPPEIKGMVSLAVGTALVLTGRLYWLAWLQRRKKQL